MSPILFVTAIDWVMKRAISNNTDGIQWVNQDQLHGLGEVEDGDGKVEHAPNFSNTLPQF